MAKAEIKCPNCNFKGISEKKPPGSCLIEIILAIVFLPAAIVYSIWRYSQKGYYCPQCGFKHTVVKKHITS